MATKDPSRPAQPQARPRKAYSRSPARPRKAAGAAHGPNFREDGGKLVTAERLGKEFGVSRERWSAMPSTIARRG